MNPKISVLIPCHNIEKLSYFSLKSVVKNKYENLEIILLNDYSTDNTLEILREYAAKDERIKVYDLKDYHEHVGIGFNRDFLIKQSTGKYFIFIDDDDKMSPDTIQEFVNNLDDDYDLMACDYRTKYEVIKHVRLAIGNIPSFINFDKNNPKEFFLNNNTFPWAKLVKKSYYEEIVKIYGISFSGGIFEDVRFIYLLFLNNPKFKFVNKKLFTYQIRNNSLSTSLVDWRGKIDSIFNCYQEVINNIQKFNLLENDLERQKMVSTFLIQIKSIGVGLYVLINAKQKKDYRWYVKESIKNYKEKNSLPTVIADNLSVGSKVVYRRAKTLFS